MKWMSNYCPEHSSGNQYHYLKARLAAGDWVTGEPMATEWLSAQRLTALGYVGVYDPRQAPPSASPVGSLRRFAAWIGRLWRRA